MEHRQLATAMLWYLNEFMNTDPFFYWLRVLGLWAWCMFLPWTSPLFPALKFGTWRYSTPQVILGVHVAARVTPNWLFKTYSSIDRWLLWHPQSWTNDQKPQFMSLSHCFGRLWLNLLELREHSGKSNATSSIGRLDWLCCTSHSCHCHCRLIYNGTLVKTCRGFSAWN